MERVPRRDRVGDRGVKSCLGRAIRRDRSIKKPLWMHPIPRLANRASMLDPRSSENMDQGDARARKKVRLGGVIIYLDSPRRPMSSSPDHRKQIRKAGCIRLAYKVHLDVVIHKLLVGAQAGDWVSSVMKLGFER